MLEKLVKYAEQVDLEPEPGFKVKYVKWIIVLGRDSGYQGVARLGDTNLGKKNPGLEFAKAPDLTTYEITGGPKNCRHFLADALSVVTLLGKDNPDQNDLGKHEFFKGLLRQAAEDVPELAGLAEVLEQRTNLDAINRDLTQAGAKPTETVTFMKDGVYPLASDSWHGWWRRWRSEHFPAEETGARMVDLLTGQTCLPLSSHFKIAGLAGVGGLSTGDSLVSFDKEAFQSYGLDSSANAAFSAQSAITYAEALNKLIRESSQNLPGIKVVHWFKDRLKNEEDDLFPMVLSGSDESEPLQAQQKAKDLLRAIRTGKKPDLARNRYYAMTMSGAAGRVMLRDWMEGPFEDLAASIDTWFEELAMVRREGDRPASDPKLIAVLAATVRDLDEIQAPQVAEIYRCAIDRRQPFPRWALAKTVLRSRADVLSGESPRYTRMGLIKAWLQRNPDAKGGEQLSPYLNEDHPEPAYQCGRLMAVYAALQRSALGDVGAGVVQRFYAAASVTPALILGRLARLSQFHLNKLKGGLPYWYEGLLASIWERIDHEIPAALDLEEQGLFALGYYQQLAEIRRPEKKPDQTETPDTESTDKE